MFPSAIDPEAFNLMDSPQTTGTPERRLLLAVLERAILDYVGNDPQEVETARQWLFGDPEATPNDFFTFPWLCQQLDLDPASTSEFIKAMPRRGKNRIAPWYFSKSTGGQTGG